MRPAPIYSFWARGCPSSKRKLLTVDAFIQYTWSPVFLVCLHIFSLPQTMLTSMPASVRLALYYQRPLSRPSCLFLLAFSSSLSQARCFYRKYRVSLGFLCGTALIEANFASNISSTWSVSKIFGTCGYFFIGEVAETCEDMTLFLLCYKIHFETSWSLDKHTL